MADDECATVQCHAPATVTLRIEADYESVVGETRTNVFTYAYCDEHAAMWLRGDIEGRRYERVEEADGVFDT